MEETAGKGADEPSSTVADDASKDANYYAQFVMEGHCAETERNAKRVRFNTSDDHFFQQGDGLAEKPTPVDDFSDLDTAPPTERVAPMPLYGAGVFAVLSIVLFCWLLSTG